MTSPTSEPLVLRHVFPATRQRVFSAWTEAEAMRQWFQPMGSHLETISLDVRVGGAFHLVLIAVDGQRTTIEGQYVAIVRPERLQFTWLSNATGGEETLVTVEFVERDTQTEIILTHERLADTDMRTGHREGWTICLNLLESYV